MYVIIDDHLHFVFQGMKKNALTLANVATDYFAALLIVSDTLHGCFFFSAARLPGTDTSHPTTE